MKKIFLGIAFLSAVAFAEAQTAEEIVNKHIEALGGKANIEKIQNLVLEGGMELMGNKMEVKIVKVPNKLYRQDISIMGMNGYTLVTDTSGWIYIPFGGQANAQQLSGDMLKEAQQQMEISDELMSYKKKGDKLELQGKEDISGTDCFKIKVTDSKGDSSLVYVDPTTWLISRSTATKEMMGQKIPAVIDYSDYKEVEGVKFPFTIGTAQGSMVFTSIKANQPVDEKMYKHE